MSSLSTSKNNVPNFRVLESGDRELLFQWRNIPEIVSLSKNQRSVSWVEHVVWFARISTDEDSLILIIIEENQPIGQIRFEKVDKKTAKFGIYLIPSAVGKKRGSYLIDKCRVFAKERWPNLQYLKADIRSENKRSIKAFESANFKSFNENFVNNNEKIISMILDLEQ